MGDRDLPPQPTELIYLPEPSWMPAFTALGVALVVVGLFSWWVYAVAGAIIGLISVVAWIRDSARRTSRLPIEQPASTAVLPAVPVRRH